MTVPAIADAMSADRIEERVRESLSQISLPDGSDPIAAEIVGDVRVERGIVTLHASFEPFTDATADRIADQIRGAAFAVPGVEHVRIDPGGPHSGVALDADVIAVASAKGGVGKSTVAVALARALDSAGHSVGLFDADLHGPNVPELVGIEGPVEATADGRPDPIDAGGIEVMSVGLLGGEGPLAWRGSMAHQVLTDVLGDTDWSGRDVIVLDLPPGTGDVLLTAVQDVPLSGALLVTTPFATSVGDTERSAELFTDNGIDVLGAVVNMAGFVCEACGHEQALFSGDATDRLGVSLLARIPFDRDVQGTPEVLADREAFAPVLETVRDRLRATATTDAIDLRGLPPRTREKQVLEELSALKTGDELTVRTGDRDTGVLLDAVDRLLAESYVEDAGNGNVVTMVRA